MDKGKLRDVYKKRRQALSVDELSAGNAALIARLQDLRWPSEGYVHVFLPILRHKEPDVWPFIHFFKRRYPSSHVVVSRTNLVDCSMEHVVLHNDLVLRENAWGIVEPLAGERVSETALDVVIIPLLIADSKGNRVGYGKGFYDRFLAACRPDCVKIGLSYFDPIEQIADVQPFDVPLDMLITPKATYRFSLTVAM